MFTQIEKKELIAKGINNTNTIHEVQGMTFKSVRIIRLFPQQMTIYDSEQHILVALTRHTELCEYLTVRSGDAICKLIYGVDDRPVDNINEANAKAAKVLKFVNIDRRGEGALQPVEIYESAYTLGFEKQYKHQSCNSEAGEKLAKKLDVKLKLTGGYNHPIDSITPVGVGYDFSNFEIKDFIILRQPRVALQNYYDSILSNASTALSYFDEYQVETNDFSTYVSGVRVDLSKLASDSAKVMPVYTYKPLLRTNQPNKRPRTARQTLLALAKRNCDAPRNSLPTDISKLAKEATEKFLEVMCHEEAPLLLDEYSKQKITVNKDTLREWISTQESKKIQRFDVGTFELDVRNVIRYSMMIKNEPKNKLEQSATEEYATVQNIIHHPHQFNAIFGSIFKKLSSRLDNLLSTNIMLMLRKSPSGMTSHLNKHLCVNTLQGSLKSYDKLEIDFAKYDKCQLQACFETEMYFWSLLGFDEYLHSLWKVGHYDCNATDFANGIKIWLMYQRKSGDSATCLGNSLVAMIAIAYTSKLKKKDIICGYFIGDDSLLYIRKEIDGEKIVRNLMEVFNLNAKLVKKVYGYMCSMFIIPTMEGYIAIPDPLKRIEKLGKALALKDHETLHERYVSFKELMMNLFTTDVDNNLIEALNERYGYSGLTQLALNALRTVAASYTVYSNLYTSSR